MGERKVSRWARWATWPRVLSAIGLLGFAHEMFSHSDRPYVIAACLVMMNFPIPAWADRFISGRSEKPKP